MSLKFTPDYIVRRIEHAGATLRCLRVKSPSTLIVTQRIEIVREHVEDAAIDPRAARHYPSPAARDVRLMDEALSWILLVPTAPKRRLLGLRSQFDPVRERLIFSWRKSAEVLGCDDKSAKEWHRQGIALIARALDGAEIMSPAGCNIVPEHIALDWLRPEMAA